MSRSSERAARLARWGLLVLAGAALVFAAGLAGRRPPPTQAYACPMHPEARAAVPGECPVCGMALVLRESTGPPPRQGGPRLPTGAVEPARSRIVSEPLLAPARVEGARVIARVYDDALPGLTAGERLAFHPAAAPSTSIEVRAVAGPFAAWDRSTSRVELQLPPGSAVAPGTAGWVEGPARPRKQLLVPISALLEGPDGPYVLVQSGGGQFLPRPVRIGRTLDGSAAVVAGLEEGERVGVRSAFFLDAERRLAAGTGASGR